MRTVVCYKACCVRQNQKDRKYLAAMFTTEHTDTEAQSHQIGTNIVTITQHFVYIFVMEKP